MPMRIRRLTNDDIPKWSSLSSEYDCYVKELTSSLTEWYEGNDNSLAFDAYMEAKINQNEAFMAVDTPDNCLGAIAFSKGNNRITFFAVAHTVDFKVVGGALLCRALDFLDESRPIYINEIASASPWMKQYGQLYLHYGFNFHSHTLENGVPVHTYVRSPLPTSTPAGTSNPP